MDNWKINEVLTSRKSRPPALWLVLLARAPANVFGLSSSWPHWFLLSHWFTETTNLIPLDRWKAVVCQDKNLVTIECMRPQCWLVALRPKLIWSLPSRGTQEDHWGTEVPNKSRNSQCIFLKTYPSMGPMIRTRICKCWERIYKTMRNNSSHLPTPISPTLQPKLEIHRNKSTHAYGHILLYNFQRHRKTLATCQVCQPIQLAKI